MNYMGWVLNSCVQNLKLKAASHEDSTVIYELPIIQQYVLSISSFGK